MPQYRHTEMDQRDTPPKYYIIDDVSDNEQ